ncbi:MAG: hypothetical protein A2010_03835 [Nitrospirae bacterium GWD2_57_9]|nr:MAG: hypothetical protein A2010_03835 [Nitrospirae bacterium GWD2_57_9]OGW51234.1 MAG: hypothetical protein A2078_00175 [Nitrospirae bacterium GWC2_57_9]
MKKIPNIMIVLVLLLAFIGAAFQTGKSVGFRTGSEWALVQADILAREAGLFMPVYMEGDTFRVVIKQPKGLYKNAWNLADMYEETRNTLCMEDRKAGKVHKNL